MQSVVYIHGYGSSGNTDTAINLRRILGPNFKLVSPTYDGSQPLGAASILEKTIGDLTSPILVGTSLGGFFTNYLALVSNLPAVIVNPSLRPSASLHKYGELPKVLAGYKHLEALAESALFRPSRVVVVGMLDDVVDPRTNGLLLREGVSTVMLNMGHRIDPAFYGTIAGLVQELAEGRVPVPT